MSYAIMVGLTVLMGLLYSWTGRLNGRFFFGRTVSAETRGGETGAAITRRYLAGIVLTTAAAAGIAWLGVHAGHRSIGAGALLVEMVAFSVIFARANGQARDLAMQEPGGDAQQSVREVTLLEQPAYWVPGVGAIVLPAALCAAALTVAVWMAGGESGFSAGWDALNSSMDGQGYASLLGLATGMLTAAAGMLLAFRSSARLRTGMARYTVRALISLAWVATALMVGLLAANRMGTAISHHTGQGVIGGAMIVTLGIVLWNQSRSRRYTPPQVELGADDRWRWGLFYVDRQDPALFVQSRCGAGYTLNYGRVAAWPITLGLIAYVVGVLFFLPMRR